jgi:hypothetical protein
MEGRRVHRATYRREYGLWLGVCNACGHRTESFESRSHAIHAFRSHAREMLDDPPEAETPDAGEDAVEPEEDIDLRTSELSA